MSVTIEPALPAGVASADGWESDDHGPTYRVLRGPNRDVAGVGSLRTSAIQYRDGSIDRGDFDGPVISLNLGGSCISVKQARQLVTALAAAAAEADRWAGGENV